MACEVFKVGMYSFAKQWLNRELVDWKILDPWNKVKTELHTGWVYGHCWECAG